MNIRDVSDRERYADFLEQGFPKEKKSLLELFN
jgi:hypothetical protein